MTVLQILGPGWERYSRCRRGLVLTENINVDGQLSYLSFWVMNYEHENIEKAVLLLFPSLNQMQVSFLYKIVEVKAEGKAI